MPNLASALKSESSRLAKKEIRSATAVTKRLVAQYRRDIAELKRKTQEQERKIAFLEEQEKRRIGKPAQEAEPTGVRFSPKWVKANRSRLGLSAADYGKLVGISAKMIYLYEQGVSKPRKGQLAALATVQGLGKREALKRLEMLEG